MEKKREKRQFDLLEGEISFEIHARKEWVYRNIVKRTNAIRGKHT